MVGPRTPLCYGGVWGHNTTHQVLESTKCRWVKFLPAPGDCGGNRRGKHRPYSIWACLKSRVHKQPFVVPALRPNDVRHTHINTHTHTSALKTQVQPGRETMMQRGHNQAEYCQAFMLFARQLKNNLSDHSAMATSRSGGKKYNKESTHFQNLLDWRSTFSCSA